MAIVPGRSKPLHNFSMPCLKWRNQKLLRCMRVNSSGEIALVDRRSSGSEIESGGVVRRNDLDWDKRKSLNLSESFKKSTSIEVSGKKSKIETDEDDTLESIREKLMFHLRKAADKIGFAIPEENGIDESVAIISRNLGTRKAVFKAPVEAGGTGREGLGSKSIMQNENSSPFMTENPTLKSLRLRGLAAAQHVVKKERAKFSISLSKKEVEEDFMAITGAKPPRRPTKRAKIIQKKLDESFPGVWLSEITPNSYKVPDPETGKR